MNSTQSIVLAIVFGLAVWHGSQIQASPQSDLAAQISAAGQNDYDNRTHKISLSHCTLTTYVYEDWGEEQRVLWSSFQIDLRDLILPRRNKDGNSVVWAPKIQDGLGIAIMAFKTVKGTVARHEVAMRRNPLPPYRVSSRQGKDSYVFRDSASFVIIHAGLETPDHSNGFIELLKQYKIEYCFPLS